MSPETSFCVLRSAISVPGDPELAKIDTKIREAGTRDRFESGYPRESGRRLSIKLKYHEY